MPKINRRNNSNHLFIFLGCSIAVYLLLRSFFVDITDDEAWSFYNIKKWWYVEALCSGNTHWLNSGAIKAAILLGFEKTWQLRWLSVVSGLTFLWIGFLWIRSINDTSTKLFAFALLFLNPYLLEYLTLARGYSGSLCLLSLSLLFFIRSINQNKKRTLALCSLIFAGLSVISNFGFLYFFLAYSVIYFYLFHFKNGKVFLKSKQFYIDLAYSIGIISLVLRALLFIRQCSNDIGIFGGENLIQSVFISYIDTLLYGNFHLSYIAKLMLAISLAAFVLTASLFGIFKFRKHSDSLYLYSSLILSIMFVLTIFNKWVFNVLYPTERTCLLFYPLIAIVIFGFLNHTIMIGSVLKKTIFNFISFLLILNFYFSINIRSGYDHPYCKDSGSYFEYLNSISADKVGMPLELYCVFLKYYQVTSCHFQGESINTFGYDVSYIKKNSLNDFEYLLLLPPYNLSYYKNSNIKLRAMKFFPDTKAIVLKVVQ